MIGLFSILVIATLISFNTAAATVPKSSGSSNGVEITSGTITITIPSGIEYSPDGKGYLKEIGPDKYLLHIEGSPYEMGYQHGYLVAEGTSRMASEEFFVKVVLGFLGMDGDGLLSA